VFRSGGGKPKSWKNVSVLSDYSRAKKDPKQGRKPFIETSQRGQPGGKAGHAFSACVIVFGLRNRPEDAAAENGPGSGTLSSTARARDPRLKGVWFESHRAARVLGLLERSI